MTPEKQTRRTTTSDRTVPSDCKRDTSHCHRMCQPSTSCGQRRRPASHHPVPGSMWTEGQGKADRQQLKKKKKKKRRRGRRRTRRRRRRRRKRRRRRSRRTRRRRRKRKRRKKRKRRSRRKRKRRRRRAAFTISMIVEKQNRRSTTPHRTVPSGCKRDTSHCHRLCQPSTSCGQRRKTCAAPSCSWLHVD